MLVFIRETAGLGDAAIYVRLRDNTGDFWDFVGLSWVTPQTNDCRVFLSEYNDSASLDSLYAEDVTVPSGGPFIQEAVVVSTGEVSGSDVTAITTTVDLTGIALTTDVTDAKDAIFAYGDLHWVSAGLSGTNSIEITVEVEALPALSVDVVVYNEDETAFIGRTTTDLNGVASFSLDDGTYSIRLIKSGFYMPVNPVETLVVNGPEVVTYEMEAIVIPVSGVPNVCRVYEYLLQLDGVTPIDEKFAIATAQATSAPYAGQILDATFNRDVDGNFTGLIYWDIVYGTSVRILIPYVLGNKEKLLVVPSVTTAQITTL